MQKSRHHFPSVLKIMVKLTRSFRHFNRKGKGKKRQNNILLFPSRLLGHASLSALGQANNIGGGSHCSPQRPRGRNSKGCQLPPRSSHGFLCIRREKRFALGDQE